MHNWQLPWTSLGIFFSFFVTDKHLRSKRLMNLNFGYVNAHYHQSESMGRSGGGRGRCASCSSTMNECQHSGLVVHRHHSSTVVMLVHSLVCGQQCVDSLPSPSPSLPSPSPFFPLPSPPLSPPLPSSLPSPPLPSPPLPSPPLPASQAPPQAALLLLHQPTEASAHPQTSQGGGGLPEATDICLQRPPL